MARETPSDRCIKTEGVYGPTSVYVVVIMDGECPVEVQVSVVEREVIQDARELATIREEFRSLEQLCNDTLAHQVPVSSLVRFLNSPPCAESGIIGAALMAALEV